MSKPHNPSSDQAATGDERADPVRDSLRGDGPERGRSETDDTLSRAYSEEDLDRMDVMLAMDLETVLPTPPKVPGLHFCWLADSQYDSLARRERAGYRAVTPDMLPGWKCGGTRGAVEGSRFRVNEMVLYCVPEQAWQRYMLRQHHEKPIAEEQRLRVNVDLLVNRVKERHFRAQELGESIGPDVRPAPQSFQVA